LSLVGYCYTKKESARDIAIVGGSSNSPAQKRHSPENNDSVELVKKTIHAHNIEVVVSVHARRTTTSEARQTHLGVITLHKRELITSETELHPQHHLLMPLRAIGHHQAHKRTDCTCMFTYNCPKPHPVSIVNDVVISGTLLRRRAHSFLLKHGRRRYKGNNCLLLAKFLFPQPAAPQAIHFGVYTYIRPNPSFLFK